MPSAHRQIADAAGAAWDRAHGLLLAARRDSAPSADLDALADYAAEQRDTWLRAVERARRDEVHHPDALSILAALDHGADDPFAEADDRT